MLLSVPVGEADVALLRLSTASVIPRWTVLRSCCRCLISSSSPLCGGGGGGGVGGGSSSSSSGANPEALFACTGQAWAHSVALLAELKAGLASTASARG